MDRLALGSVHEPDTGIVRLRLENGTNETFSDFALHVSGPARIARDAEIEGARLVSTLSNHAELAAPDGFALAPGAAMEIVIRSGYRLNHWTDGPTGAYLALSDGTTRPIHVRPAEAGLKGRMALPLPEGLPDGAPVSVIPWPAEVAISDARPCPAGLSPLARSEAGERAGAVFSELTAALFPAEAMMRGRDEGGLAVFLSDAEGLAPEAYRIGFEAESVTVEASGQTGFLYGLITLGQIWRGARLAPQSFVFPAGGSISDAPQMGWRGCHLDTARQFYAAGEIAQFLKVLAWNKLNRFHWHLSDDEAWRLEIAAFPELTEIGAWRGHGLAVPSLLGSAAEPMGGVYAQDTVRDLDGLAKGLGITVVPEIDIPGHSFALLAALPHLRDPNEKQGYRSVQGFPENCLNPAHEPVYAFLETVIGEMATLFSGGILHIGADEVPLGAWSGSKLALDRLPPELRARHAARLGQEGHLHGADAIEGSPTALLQAEFIRRVDAMIAAHGLVAGGWEEAAHGDALDARRAYLVGWRDPAASRALAARGYDIVVAPGQRYYLDMANGPDFFEPGASWAGWSGPAETYGFDPLESWSAAERAHLLGIQACIWSEPMRDRAVFDRLVFPRLSAIAETGWTPPEGKDFSRFIAIAGLMPSLYGHAEQTRTSSP
jgi:hexosaminidase